MAGESSLFERRGAQEQLENHIGKDDERRRIPLTVPLATEFPVIDLRRFVAASEAELFHLRSAFTSWGCFQVVNHGIESSLLDAVRRISREFFQLPMSEKQKYATQDGEDEGFGTDVLVVEDQFLDWSENLGLRILPQHRQNPKYWPQNPHSFRKVFAEYTDKLRDVEAQILKLVAKSLKLSDEDIFIKKISSMYAQLNYYPPFPKPDQVLGLRQHSDSSFITILLQDDKVGGLQLLKDDTWFSAPTVPPHALFVFAGDQLQKMSNGMFKSNEHRVVRLSAETDRCTLAVFCTPDFTQEIGPLDELVDNQRPRLFKNVTNYVKFFFPYLYQGKRAIHQLRI